MIRYSLRCDKGHEFEGWFRSAQAFDAQKTAGQINCGFCGSANVEKALMAPSVPKKGNAADTEAAPAAPRPEAEIVEAIAKLRAHIEANSDYVGASFATEARAMHEGRSPTRAIHGEAKPDEARALIEDGVPIAPLPFRPRQKTS